jgi:hypothetical protein
MSFKYWFIVFYKTAKSFLRKYVPVKYIHALVFFGILNIHFCAHTMPNRYLCFNNYQFQKAMFQNNDVL